VAKIRYTLCQPKYLACWDQGFPSSDAVVHDFQSVLHLGEELEWYSKVVTQFTEQGDLQGEGLKHLHGDILVDAHKELPDSSCQNQLVATSHVA
jgi:hypothetical protein